MGGSSNGGQPGVYGILQSPSTGNIPGGRRGASTWTDSSGNFWLFGGLGYDINGTGASLNDLWEFNPATNEWTWMGGSSTVNQPGVYGTLGTPSAGNIPSARECAVGWSDSKGNLWLFGGVPAAGDLNDFWEYSPSTNEWTWVGGSSTVNHPGVYGTLGTPATGNIPAARDSAAGWTDSKGNFWLFGGTGFDGGYLQGEFNDLWEYSPSTSEWTWMSGSSTTANEPGEYGTLGTPSAGTVPGGRASATSWTDNTGNFWLFGGYGFDTNDRDGLLNDLWEFNPATNEWTWVGGSEVLPCTNLCGAAGTYGTLGSPATGNIPGGRGAASSWTDSKGNFWLFGGGGDGVDLYYGINDLWEYQPSTTHSYTAVATPVITLAAGTYSSAQTTTITDPTASAAIYYTTNGTTPTPGSTLYTGAITVSASETLQAIAVASNYFNSAVTSAAYTIPTNFSVPATLPAVTVTTGTSWNETITVTPINEFTGTVSFSCSGLPTEATCSFLPATVTGSGSTQITVTATAPNTAALRGSSFPLLPGSALAAVVCCFGLRKRRRLQMLVLVVVSVAGLSLVTGCGGGASASKAPSYTPLPNTETVTVTASSGSLSHTTTFTLTVND
jgi:N-acetylneuraminic acid mutarotase